MTLRARDAVERADTVVGYTTYVRLVEGLLSGKDVRMTGMKAEKERCAEAIELAARGRKVALVSGGDPGIYGMAGLAIEMARERWNGGRPSFVLEVIPGVPAVCSAAASLGAPLMHDFAVISLSDLLTPWELIERRVEAAASADFVMAIYNPRSISRPDNLGLARDIILRHRGADTPAGIVKDSTREGEAVIISTLGDMPVEDVDMTTLVIVGNSQTGRFLDYLVTPRGYKL